MEKVLTDTAALTISNRLTNYCVLPLAALSRHRTAPKRILPTAFFTVDSTCDM
jgi:hypothetical protein